MMHMGKSSGIRVDDIQDKNARLMRNTKGIIINEDKINTAAATNLGNRYVAHQEIRDLKLVDRSNLSLHDDQETARSINKGKNKIHMGESIINQNWRRWIIERRKQCCLEIIRIRMRKQKTERWSK